MDRDAGGDLWLQAHTGSRGVGAAIAAHHLLVEVAPAAYRDIGEVLEDEEDLVTPVLRLTPLAVLKG